MAPDDRAAKLVIEADFLAVPKMQKFRCYLSAGVNTRRYGPGDKFLNVGPTTLLPLLSTVAEQCGLS